jgi:hypothetical protein
MVEAGEADVIVAAYFDRLVRSLKTQTELLERVEAAGGKVRAVDAGDISAGTSGEWLDSTMRGMMAEYQRRQVIERVRPAMERMIARGVSAGASVPAGYLRPRAEDGSPLPFVIDAETAPVIRQVFEARAAGASYPQLCRMLESAGIVTGRGNVVWKRQTLHKLIANDAYMGIVRFGRQFVKQDAHPAIVDLPTWQAAQRPAVALRPTRAPSDEFLLSGIVRCAACGYLLEGSRDSAKHGKRRRYRCRGRHSAGVCEARVWVSAEPLERTVSEWYRKLLVEVLEVKHPSGSLTIPGAEPELRTLEQALATAERRLEQANTEEVQDAFGDGWAAMARERREARDVAALELGRASVGKDQIVATDELLALWDGELAVADRRKLIAELLPVIAVERSTRHVLMFSSSVPQPEVPRRGSAKLVTITDNDDALVVRLPRR